MKTRKEKNTMGTVQVPAEAFYGVHPQRAVATFPAFRG